MPKHHRQYPLSFALNHWETHPAYGGGSKGRRRSEADRGDGTGELHGGDIMAPMAGTTGIKQEAVFVGCRLWPKNGTKNTYLLVAGVRAFFLMSFSNTKIIGIYFCIGTVLSHCLFVVCDRCPPF